MFLNDLTIQKVHDGLKHKAFSAREITSAYFDRIEKYDDKIGAYLSLSKSEALAQADAVDAFVAKGEELPELAGVPIAIKDSILVQGQPATAGSNMLKNYIAAYDATVIKKLKAAGAVIVGKTNLDEFTMGSSTENSAFKQTKNPHDLERVPGGSSGGSAAAVAADLVLTALGSDTGGSIRQPAGLCGITGLKPTYGAVSRYGSIPMASSLDQIGVLTKTTDDVARVFKVIAGHDDNDATSEDAIYGDELLHSDLDKIKKLVIGLPKEFFASGLEKEVMDETNFAIDRLKKLGFQFKDVSLPHAKYALSAYYIIAPAEISANLARYDSIRYAPVDGVDRNAYSLEELYRKNRSIGFGPEVKRRIILGTFVLSSGYYDAYYNKAQKVRTLIRRDFEEAFKTVDVIMAPVSPTRAFKFGDKINDSLAMYLADIFTIPVSLAGLPGLSVPVKKYTVPNLGTSQLPNSSTHELPVGFQLIGKHFHEADILGVGRMYERE